MIAGERLLEFEGFFFLLFKSFEIQFMIFSILVMLKACCVFAKDLGSFTWGSRGRLVWEAPGQLLIKPEVIFFLRNIGNFITRASPRLHRFYCKTDPFSHILNCTECADLVLLL